MKNGSQKQIERSLFQERLIACLSSFFRAHSPCYSPCVGLYGLLSYEVTQRNAGNRHSHGAWRAGRPRCIAHRCAPRGRTGQLLAAIIGILVALGATRYLASLLYGVSPILIPLRFLAVCFAP